MAQISQQTIPKDKFLMIAANLLHRQFIAAGRTAAKQLYREIEAGRVMPMTTVKMEDESTVQFSIELDHSEFQGHLNFSAFKASVSSLLGNFARALQEKKEVTVFSQDRGPNAVLFGITGPTVEDNQANVMMLGSDGGGVAGAVMLRLMYLDPAQFSRPDDAAGTDPAGTQT